MVPSTCPFRIHKSTDSSRERVMPTGSRVKADLGLVVRVQLKSHPEAEKGSGKMSPP